MYTVQKLQAADYLLKKLIKQNSYPFYDSEIKIVIELNGKYWYGDFVPVKNGTVEQFFICDDGDVDYTRFYDDGTNAITIFKKIRDKFYSETRISSFYINPFKNIKTLDLLFNTIFKLVDLADIQPDDSPIYPYLLNAKTLDNNLELPFINIGEQKS